MSPGGSAVVGIVVVSHSRALAQAAVALAREMVHGRALRVHVAAGMDDGSFGTDAMAILEAVNQADSGDGVVVLMDLGSAVMSAELALEMLDDDARDRVVLCAAPLVEGLVVAAVAASAGADRHEVAAEAVDALAGKQSHLGAAPAGQGVEAVPGDLDEGIVGTFTVDIPHGLHARPAALVVQAVREHDAHVELRNLTSGAGPVPADSLSKVATLGALHGHEVQVLASGPQAREALDHVLALARGSFGEASGAAPGAAPASAAVPAGASHSGVGESQRDSRGDGGVPVPSSPGVGIGPVTHMQPSTPEIHDVASGDPAGEWLSLQDAIGAVRVDLQRIRATTAREVGDGEAAIFDAHLLLLDDPAVLDDARADIDAGRSAGAAWAAAVGRARGGLADVPDPYLQARAADIDAVGTQVLRALVGSSGSLSASEGVLVAPDLTPAEAAELDGARVVAVVLAYGSPTAHSAILVRAKGIPAVVGAGPGLLDVPPGSLIAVDGDTGEVVVDPSRDILARFRERADTPARRRADALAESTAPAVTRDGVTVLVAANLGSVEDARSAVANGADLAGLVRTEFLFLGRELAPDADEQGAVYRSIAEALKGRRCTLRTLDVGGDKPLRYLPMPLEANPFLGVRGVRLSLARPALLADQLLAVVRVAHDHPIDVMFPMVSTLDELLAVRSMLDDAILAVGAGTPAGFRIGIMVEVPAAALKIASFAPHVDFVSIGTNDLTQYTLAAERGNQSVAPLGDPLDPGVLLLVDAVCRGAGDTPVAVCGEVAADETAAALLVGLGVRELSVSPAAIPGVKEAVRMLDTGRAALLAAAALDADSARSVRALVAGPWRDPAETGSAAAPGQGSRP